MSTLPFTGERVVPNAMAASVTTWRDHLARYVWALGWCHGRVLDAACGTGYGTSILAPSASEIVGIDLSREAMDYAMDICQGLACPVMFYRLDLEADELPGNFDTIVSFETIEHLEDPRHFLTQVRDKCRGTFLFSIPLNNASAFHKVVYTFDDVIGLVRSTFQGSPFALVGQDTAMGSLRFTISPEAVRRDGIYLLGIVNLER